MPHPPRTILATFITRPIATSLLMLAIVLLGVLAYRALPIAALPQVDYPTLQIRSTYPGASPEVVAATLTAPLERRLGQIAGLEAMHSISGPGLSLITLRFGLQVSLDIAEQDVQAALAASATLLPPDLPQPPIYNKVNPADAPIMTLAVTSPALPVPQINDWVETRVAQQLSQIAGVGLVSIAGGRRPAVRVQVDTQALAAQNLSLEDIRQAIANSSSNLAKGSLDGPARAMSINANDQLRSASDYADVVVAYKNGVPVRVRNLATLRDDVENPALAAWANRQEAIILTIQRQPGANVIDVANRIKATLPTLQSTLPASLDVQIINDRTHTIRAAVRSVQIELMIATVLVVAVMFVFLRSWRATLIPSLAIPLSLLGTLVLMHLLGFSLNNLTLMALVISTGFVVDDAIVMIENIARHLEAGLKPLEAALKGAQEIAFTIVSLTVSLVAVLIPLLLMPGLVGRLLHEFAVTLGVAIGMSALVSLTLTPMMCAHLLKANAVAHAGHPAGGWMPRTLALYNRALLWVFAHPNTTLAVFAGSVLLTLALFVAIPKGLFPQQDTGSLQGITVGPPSIAHPAMRAQQEALVNTLLQDPAIESIASFVGVDGQNTTPNSGRLVITLKPLAERPAAKVVMERLQKLAEQQSGQQTNNHRGLALYLQASQDLNLDSIVGKTPYSFMLSSPQADTLSAWVPRVEAALREQIRPSGVFSRISTDWQPNGLTAHIQINRVAAARLGVAVADIDTALYNAFGQRFIATLFTQSNQYRVVLESAQARQAQATGDPLQTLAQVHVPSSTGQSVPLAAMASFSQRTAPLSLQRLDQLPAVQFAFDPAPGVSLGQAVASIRQTLASLGLPATVQMQVQGATAAFEASLPQTTWLLAAALVTVYIVLGVLYESTLHPITILSTLPSAGIGALLTLWAMGKGLDIVGVVGMVLLIGIVKKNAIMMIDFALDAQRNQSLSPQEAIHQACLLRFRPILMTTLAALLGALPLMLGTGFGAELRQPLGYALVGGLALSQLLTLFTTPIIYLKLEGWSARKAMPPSDRG